MITITTICATVPGLTEADLLRFVEAEWVRPQRQSGQPVFSETDLARIQLIQDLRTELEVEETTLPLVLSLLDQLYATRRQLRRIATAAGPELRAVIVEAMGGEAG
jgi:chaperone modulatory protein CbpM